jgi:hypothetical protein
MFNTVLVKIILICSIGLTVASCGSDESAGGNVTEFTTSYASASASTTRLEADLITGNTCTAPVTPGTLLTETVDFTISTTSTVKATSVPAVTPLPISITGYTVTYTPKNAGIPALSPTTGVTTVIINPSASATISVPISTDLQKLNLISANPSLPCSLNIYQYDVSVSFNAVEVGISGSKTITAALVLAIADRNN